MSGELFTVNLWFSSSTEEMRHKLVNTSHNSGVGLNIPVEWSHFFDKIAEIIEIQFDDGTTATATVKKDNFNSCTDLIDPSIGVWPRKNGLWKASTNKHSVPISVEVVKDFKVYRVSYVY